MVFEEFSENVIFSDVPRPLMVHGEGGGLLLGPPILKIGSRIVFG